MIDKSKCTGCAACASICPVSAIDMRADREGFLYPEVDNLQCIHCGVCDKVCPSIESRKPHITDSMFYCMKSKNVDTQMNSASGGIFPEIASYILSKGGYVWGAAFDRNNNVIHQSVERIEDINKLCRSKYVQSCTEGIYQEVKNQLSAERVVLFTGTPCQTTALAKYVGKQNRNKLYLVDIICHGVPSPLVWQEYLRELSDAHGERKENIKEIDFKYKDELRKWLRPGFRVAWNDGNEYVDYSNNTWYENGFLGNLYVRPSCHRCELKSLSSESDLTIGDFWGCKEVMPTMYDENGVSLIAVKTVKGQEILAHLLEYTQAKKITSALACKYNSRITLPASQNENRNKFWKIFYETENKEIHGMDSLVMRLNNKPIWKRMKNKIVKMVIEG